MHDIPSFSEVCKQLSPLQKVGQLFMPAAFINDTEEEVQRLERLIREYHIGSICFFHSRASAATNFEGKKEVIHNTHSYDRLIDLIERYQSAAAIPLLIAIDAEWGLAMRIENTNQYPFAITLGAMTHAEHLVHQVGKQIGYECRNAGIHWNLAPVVDINLNPENPVIGYRSFGNDRKNVTHYAKAYINGMREAHILNAIKHFPGHGDTDTDSHLGLPIIEKEETELLTNELYPFIQLLDDHADVIMVGHVSVPKLTRDNRIAASLSEDLMTHFLRGRLGWQGLIISDALNMHAISKNFTQKGDLEYHAFKAGNDVLCFPIDIIEGIEKITETCSTTKIDSSFERFWTLKQKAFQKAHTTLKANYDHAELMTALAQESLTMLKGNDLIIKTFREKRFQLKVMGSGGGYFEKCITTIEEKCKRVLLTIVPRQVKPKDFFGFSVEELQCMKKILRQSETIIYLFGNPFFLNLLPWTKAKAVVVAYQDFPEFQENAHSHFMGQIQAKGKLPVTLKRYESI